MTYFLMTWDCRGVKQEEWAIGIQRKCETLGNYSDRWSTGGTKRIGSGDRVFLLRQAKEPRGIVAIGTVTSSPKIAPHWDSDQRAAGKTAVYVYLVWHHFIAEPSITEDSLPAEIDGQVDWKVRRSGTSLPESVGARLWSEFIARMTCSPAMLGEEDLRPSVTYREGAVCTVLVNGYERNKQARAECLRVHGYRCKCCDVILSEIYGDAAADNITLQVLRRNIVGDIR